MEKLSGLVLDLYDDETGAVMRDIFPTIESVPALIKQAHLLSREDRSLLPDDAFALVLLDGPVRLRKYACVDAGNVAASVEYFLHDGGKLPEQAQKVAAANLVTACGWYGLPENHVLEKIALGQMLANMAGKAITNFKANPLQEGMKWIGRWQTANAVKDAFGQAKQNLQQVGAGMMPNGQRALQGGF